MILLFHLQKRYLNAWVIILYENVQDLINLKPLKNDNLQHQHVLLEMMKLKTVNQTLKLNSQIQNYIQIQKKFTLYHFQSMIELKTTKLHGHTLKKYLIRTNVTITTGI